MIFLPSRDLDPVSIPNLGFFVRDSISSTEIISRPHSTVLSTSTYPGAWVNEEDFEAGLFLVFLFSRQERYVRIGGTH